MFFERKKALKRNVATRPSASGVGQPLCPHAPLTLGSGPAEKTKLAPRQPIWERTKTTDLIMAQKPVFVSDMTL